MRYNPVTLIRSLWDCFGNPNPGETLADCGRNFVDVFVCWIKEGI